MVHSSMGMLYCESENEFKSATINFQIQYTTSAQKKFVLSPSQTAKNNWLADLLNLYLNYGNSVLNRHRPTFEFIALFWILLA